MSKLSDEKIEQKTGQKNFHPMSSRQQLLYLLKESNSNTTMEDKEEILLNYHKYYLYKKEKYLTSLPRAVQLERAKSLKQSLKEFIQIKKNIYIDRKKYAFTDDEAYVCTCQSPKFQKEEAERITANVYEKKHEDELFGCGRGCLNKMVSWECVEHLCPSGEGCRNRRFQMHQYADVYPVKTSDRGYGLNAGNFLPKGTFVMQYIGEIYSIDSEYGQKRLNEYKNKTCTYLMSLSKNEVIDPTYKGNLARFINHSCDPNCETQKWHVLGEICVGIFTLRDIHPNEELTFNYGFNILKTTFQKCLCGAPSCRGYLGIVANNDLPVKGITAQILCERCKRNCKSNEIIIVCETCKKVYHRACTKKKASGSKSTEDFICTACIKKTINAGNNTNTNTNSNSTSNVDTLTQSITELSFKSNSVQKQKKKLTKQNLPSVKEEISTSSNYINDIESIINVPISCAPPLEIKKSQNSQNLLPVTPVQSSAIQEETRKKEDDTIIDESLDFEEPELRKIQKNLKTLSNIGARLFWDFRQLHLSYGTSNKIEFKVTGTTRQIEAVKEMISKILAEKEDSSDSFSVTLQVPKIFVRKIIGHQNRNLNSFRSKYNVDIEYDQALITDDIFPIQESSTLTVKGKENSVKAVENEIKVFIYNLKVLTIFLMSSDYLFIKANICHLKTIVDPADMRLRKKDYKNDKEIKHSFYYIPNSNKDLVIIGFDSEIQKGEKTIKEFILRQNTLEFNYSLCFLCPNYLSSQINIFRNENKNLLANKNILLKVIDPLYARRHVNVQIEGKWKDIVEVKSLMFRYFIAMNEKYNSCWNNNSNSSSTSNSSMANNLPNTPSYSNSTPTSGGNNSTNQRIRNGILEFQQYAYNQEHKLLSKNLKSYFLEANSFIKNWDVLSDEVYQACNSALTSNNVGMNLSATNSLSLFPNPSREKEDTVSYLKRFLQISDRDTRLNYLLHLPLDSYNTVFGYSNHDMIKELTNYVHEAFESFNETKKEETSANKQNVSVESEVKESENPISVIAKEKYEIPEEIRENFTEENAEIEVKEEETEKHAQEHCEDENIPSVFPTINPKNGFTTTIDNIQNTLLNKLNSMRNENNSGNMMSQNTEEKNLKVSFPSNKYDCLVNHEGIHSNENLNGNEQLAGSSLSDSMNISYNFSNINQMNINININNLKDFIKAPGHVQLDKSQLEQLHHSADVGQVERETESIYSGSKRRNESGAGLLKRKVRPEKHLSPPYYEKKRAERDFERDRLREREKEYYDRDRGSYHYNMKHISSSRKYQNVPFKSDFSPEPSRSKDCPRGSYYEARSNGHIRRHRDRESEMNRHPKYPTSESSVSSIPKRSKSSHRSASSLSSHPDPKLSSQIGNSIINTNSSQEYCNINSRYQYPYSRQNKPSYYKNNNHNTPTRGHYTSTANKSSQPAYYSQNFRNREHQSSQNIHRNNRRERDRYLYHEYRRSSRHSSSSLSRKNSKMKYREFLKLRNENLTNVEKEAENETKLENNEIIELKCNLKKPPSF